MATVHLQAISQPCTNYCKRSLVYSRAVLWNSLPLDILVSLSLYEFKSKVKNYDMNSSKFYLLLYMASL